MDHSLLSCNPLLISTIIMVDVPKTAVVYDDETSEPVPLLDDAPEASRKNGTRSDVLSMWRLGKKQEFLRNFKFISIFGFSMILMSSWEIMLGYVLIFQTEASTYRPEQYF